MYSHGLLRRFRSPRSASLVPDNPGRGASRRVCPPCGRVVWLARRGWRSAIGGSRAFPRKLTSIQSRAHNVQGKGSSRAGGLVVRQVVVKRFSTTFLKGDAHVNTDESRAKQTGGACRSACHADRQL